MVRQICGLPKQGLSCRVLSEAVDNKIGMYVVVRNSPIQNCFLGKPANSSNEGSAYLQIEPNKWPAGSFRKTEDWKQHATGFLLNHWQCNVYRNAQSRLWCCEKTGQNFRSKVVLTTRILTQCLICTMALIPSHCYSQSSHHYPCR